MMHALNMKSMKWLVVLVVVLLVGALVTAVAAQDDGEFVLSENDTKLNVDVYIGGANVYCVDQWKQSATTFENGGGFLVLDPEGGELLFVPEEAIVNGVATMQSTGQYQLLGMGERGWYGGNPVAIYILPNGEFQLNAADDWGKPVDFQWRECRNVTISTGDGCQPGWDRSDGGSCVYRNLY